MALVAMDAFSEWPETFVEGTVLSKKMLEKCGDCAVIWGFRGCD